MCVPPPGGLEKFGWYYLLDHDLFYICTKFHSNRSKDIEIWRGANNVPTLGLWDLKIAWAL